MTEERIDIRKVKVFSRTTVEVEIFETEKEFRVATSYGCGILTEDEKAEARDWMHQTLGREIVRIVHANRAESGLPACKPFMFDACDWPVIEGGHREQP